MNYHGISGNVAHANQITQCSCGIMEKEISDLIIFLHLKIVESFRILWVWTYACDLRVSLGVVLLLVEYVNFYVRSLTTERVRPYKDNSVPLLNGRDTTVN